MRHNFTNTPAIWCTVHFRTLVNLISGMAWIFLLCLLGLMGDKASFVKFSSKCGVHNHLSRGARYTYIHFYLSGTFSVSLLYPYFLLRQLSRARVSSSGGVIGPRHRGPSPSWCCYSLLQKIGGKVTYFIPGLCDSTITEPDIDIDVEVLPNFVILRCYWYCNFLNLVIHIDIANAKENSPLSLLVLILQDHISKYQYWYWYCNVKWEDCPFDIEIADCVNHWNE